MSMFDFLNKPATRQRNLRQNPPTSPEGSAVSAEQLKEEQMKLGNLFAQRDELQSLIDRRNADGTDAGMVLQDDLEKVLDEITDQEAAVSDKEKEYYKFELLQRINAMKIGVSAKTEGRLPNLNASLANQVFSANRLYMESGGEDFLAQYLTQANNSDEFSYMLNAFSKDNSTPTQFVYMKNLSPAAAQAEIDAMGNTVSTTDTTEKTEDTTGDESITDTQQDLANLRAERRGQPPLFPRSQRRGRGGGSEKPANDANVSENMRDATIADKNMNQEAQHNGGKDGSVLAEANDMPTQTYQNTQENDNWATFVKENVLSFARFAKQYLQDTIQPVSTTPPSHSKRAAYEYVNSAKNTEPRRLQLSKNESMLKNAASIPFLIIGILAYRVNAEESFSGSQNMLTRFKERKALETILSFAGLNAEEIQYALRIYGAIPQSLVNAMRKNIQAPTDVSEFQKDIKDYVSFVLKEFEKTFQSNGHNISIQEAIKKVSGGKHFGYYQMLISLHTPRTLHTLMSMFTTLGNVLGAIQNDNTILLGLMELVAEEARGKDDMTAEMMLSYSNCPGIVRYNRRINPSSFFRKSIEISALEASASGTIDKNLIESERGVGLYKDGNNYVVAFRGTDFKNQKDIIDNFINFSGQKGSIETLMQNKQFSQRMKTGNRFLQKALLLQRQTHGRVSVAGYSLGGVFAAYVASTNPNIPVRIYNPVFSNSDDMRTLLTKTKHNPDVMIEYVEGDPISSNVPILAREIGMDNVKMRKRNKLLTPHRIENFL